MIEKFLTGINVVFCAFIATITSGSIEHNHNGDFIGVYSNSAEYNWFESNQYCMQQFGSSLASIHSSTDNANAIHARLKDDINTWIGLVDYKHGWQWSDGSSYDYEIDWNINSNGSSANDLFCSQLYPTQSEDTYFSQLCTNTCKQWICHLTENWYPIFKISKNTSDFGSASNIGDYWLNGNPSYFDYDSELEYVENEFNGSVIDEFNNFKSMIINDWQIWMENSYFSQVKLSVYRQGMESDYFIFEANSSSDDWFSQNNLIYSTYGNAITESNSLWRIHNGMCSVLLGMTVSCTVCLHPTRSLCWVMFVQ